jgi:replicative DNA helicase
VGFVSNLSYDYVESGIVLNVEKYADLQKIGIMPDQMAVFGEALQFVYDTIDETRKAPSTSILLEKFPDLDASAEGAAELEFFSGEVKHQLMYRRSVALATEYIPQIKDDNPQETLSKLIQSLGDLTAVIDDDIEVYDSGATNRADEYLEKVAKRKDNKLGILGIPTPFKTVNRLGVGFMPGELYSLFARPTVGKSFICIKCAAIAVQRGYKVLLVSTEMPVSAMALRMDAFLGRLKGYKFSLHKLRRGDEGIDVDKYREYLDSLGENNMIFPHHLGFDALSVESIRNLVRKYTPDIVIVDGVYLLSDQDSKAKWEQNDNLFKGLKNIAMAYDIPVFCTTQAGRDASNLFKPPKLNQVANGDALLRASDMALAMCKVEEDDMARYVFYMKMREDQDISHRTVMKWDVDVGDVQEILAEGPPPNKSMKVESSVKF